MSKRIDNAFTSYELTDMEAIQGQIFNTFQLQMLQNMLSEYATNKLALVFDSNNITESLQKEAEISGQISLLQQLIATSAESQKLLVEQT